MCHLEHPNVLSLIGICVDAERPYLIMPLMERGSLLIYLRKERKTLLMHKYSQACEVIKEFVALGYNAYYNNYCRCAKLKRDCLTCAIK